MQAIVRDLWFLLYFGVCVVTTATNGHTSETTLRLAKTEEPSLLKCESDADCRQLDSQLTNSSIPLICDDLEKRCKCPLTFGGSKVTESNGRCDLAQEQSLTKPLNCRTDSDCQDWMHGAVCSTGGKCECRRGMSHDGGMPHDGDESRSCAEEPTPWNEWVTLKWMFVAMIIGYPVLTMLFVIFHKEKDDHWFFEKFAAILHWTKQNKVEKQRKQKLRRNTTDDLASSDDDESPLEMEFV